MQSLKDLKSKNVSSLKVDGSVRTVAGTFAIASNQITGLPTGNKIQAGDRIDLTYTTVATQIETGLVGIADVTGLEPDLGILRIDKTLSQFATIGAVEAAFTDGLLLSFQSGILAGATCNVKYSTGLVSTAADGSAVGDTGYWLVCFNFTTATGLPPLTAWTFPPPIDGTDYTTISPDIAVFSGVAGPQSLNNLIVSSIVSPTSIAITQTIPNVASFTDVSVTKHSKINDTLITENIEATKLNINNEEILPQEHKILSALQIPGLTHVWKGIDDAGDPICSLDTELGEITPTDAFNVGVDIVTIQMLSHPIDKTIGILLYQNISDSKIYVRCFKFTYSGGFDIVYTPHEIVGADSIDVRMDVSTLISPDGIISDPLLLIFGGKDTPGPSIYAGVLEINTTTLAITDFLAWGDTIQDVPSANDFTGLIKAIDFRRVKISVLPDPVRQIGILFNTNRIAYVSFNVQASTFSASWDVTSAYVDIKNNYFGAAGSGEILCVATDRVVNITSGGDGTVYPVDTNNYATFKKQFYGTTNGTLTLFNIDRYKGIGAETIITEGFNEDFSEAVRSNVSYEAFPYNFQYTSAERNDNAVFELGDDKLLFYRSLFYYVIVNKVTGKIVDAARSAGNQDGVYKDNLLAILLNSHTLLYWDSSSSSWATNKFLYDGPYLAYKNESGFVHFANPGNRIKTSFTLEKGKTYYDSYHDTLTGTVSRISPIQGMNPKKIGVALDVDTFIYDPDFSPSTKSKKPTSFGIGSLVSGGTANRVPYIDGAGNLADSASLKFQNNKLGVVVGANAPEFEIQTFGKIASGIAYVWTQNGTINDVVNGGSNYLGIGHTGSASLTGIANPFTLTTGTTVFYLYNASATIPLTIKHQDAGSLAVNRINTPTGIDYSIKPLATCILLGNETGWTIIGPDINSNQIIFDTSVPEPFDNVCTTWNQVLEILNYLNTKKETFIEIIIMQSGTIAIGDGSSFYDFSRCKIKNGKGQHTILSFTAGNTINMPYELENVSIRNNTTSGYFAVATNYNLKLTQSSLIQSSACTTWAFLSLSHEYYIDDYGGSASGNGVVKESGAIEPIRADGDTVIYNLHDRAGISDDVITANATNINYFNTTSNRIYLTTQTNGGTVTHTRRIPITAPIAVTGTGTVAIDLSATESFNVTPSGNITLNMSNPTSGGTYVFIMKPGATPFTIAFTQTIKWKGGTVYAANTANATDIVTLYYDGTDYYGNFGEDYA